MKSRRSMIVCGCLVLVAAAAFNILGGWLDGPVSVKPDNSAVLGDVSTSDESESKKFVGKNFTTSISSEMSIKTNNQQPQGTRLEQILAVRQRAQEGDRLAITVGKTPIEGLESLSDIQFRKNNPEVYQKIDMAGMPDDALVFSNLKTYEISVFWEHDTRYSSVVQSGLSSRKDQLDRSLLKIVGDWQWK